MEEYFRLLKTKILKILKKVRRRTKMSKVKCIRVECIRTLSVLLKLRDLYTHIRMRFNRYVFDKYLRNVYLEEIQDETEYSESTGYINSYCGISYRFLEFLIYNMISSVHVKQIHDKNFKFYFHGSATLHF